MGGAKFHLSQEIQLLYESSKSDYLQFGLATLTRVLEVGI